MKFYPSLFLALSLTVGLLPNISIAAQGDVSEYNVTIYKIELCSDSNCTKSLTLSDNTFQADIANSAAGAEVGNMALNFTPTIGDSFTHIAMTISRTFTVTGEWNAAGGCTTSAAGAAYKLATGAVAAAASITMYIADGTATGYTVDLGQSANWGNLDNAVALTWVDGTHATATQAKIVYTLTTPYTVSDTPPDVKVTINTQNTVAQFAACGANSLGIKDPSFEFSIN